MNKQEYTDHINHGLSFLHDDRIDYETLGLISKRMNDVYTIRN